MAFSRYLSAGKVLTLDRFAELFGLNQVAFNQGTFEPVCHYGCMTGCNEFWYQGPYQAGASHVTRDDLAQAIVQAERDLANFWSMPICPEEKCVILPYNGGCGLGDNRSYGSYMTYGSYGSPYAPSLSPRQYGLYLIPNDPVMALGRQSLVELCTAETIIYDRNGDAYTTKNNVDCPKRVVLECEAVDGLDVSEVEIYHTGHLGDRAYRVEPSSVVLSEGILTIEIDPWRAVRPELWENPAECSICLTSNSAPILDLLDPNAYPDEFIVARRFFDPSLPAVEFGWHGNTGCACGECDICALAYCPGCLVGDTSQLSGSVRAMRARWDEDLETWCGDTDCHPLSRQPDFVKIYYWYGYTASQGYCTAPAAFDCREAEQIIAMLAASRLLKTVCHCVCDKAADRFGDLQVTMNYTSRNEGSYFISMSLLENPFGTRRGEVDAYRKALAIKKNMRGGMVTTGAI
jgi:hypothetical protein